MKDQSQVEKGVKRRRTINLSLFQLRLLYEGLIASLLSGKNPDRETLRDITGLMSDIQDLIKEIEKTSIGQVAVEWSGHNLEEEVADDRSESDTIDRVYDHPRELSPLEGGVGPSVEAAPDDLVDQVLDVYRTHRAAFRAVEVVKRLGEKGVAVSLTAVERVIKESEIQGALCSLTRGRYKLKENDATNKEDQDG